MTDKVRENRLRRMAERQGFTLTKSKARDPKALTFGKFALKDAKGDLVPGGWDKSADEIEALLESGALVPSRDMTAGLLAKAKKSRSRKGGK